MDNLDMLFPENFINHLKEKYELLENIGSGAMGYVIKAKDIALDRVVAIKILFRTKIDEVNLQRFENEAKLIAKLDHPNIVTIYDYNNFEGTRYIVEKYLPNGNLEDYIKSKTKLEVNEAVSIIKDILSALDYAHNLGIVHRDIKPANIIFDSDHRAIITDFGIAKFTKWESKITMPGEYVGTPEFLSPEQAMGKEVTLQTDLYAVGVMLYFMLSGKLPFSGDNPISIAYQHVNESPKPISEHIKINPFIEKIIDKALQKELNERFKSAKEFLNNVELINTSSNSSSNTISSKAITVDNKKKNRKVSLYILLIIIVLLSLFLINTFQEPKGEYKIKKIHVSASSNDTKKINNSYFAKNVLDGKRNTCWEEGVEGHGTGEYLLFTFKSPKKITRFGVIPGYDKVEDDKYGDRWTKNNRVKKAQLLFSDNSDTVVTFRDSRELQFIYLNKITRYIKFTILDVYEGDKWDDTAISEVEIWGMSLK